MSKGADPNCQDEQQATPLHYAAQGNQRDIVQVFKPLIYAHRVDSSSSLFNIVLPLHPCLFCRQALLKRGASPLLKDVEGRSALSWAVMHRAQEAVSLLLRSKQVN